MSSANQLRRLHDVVSYWAKVQPDVDAWRYDGRSETYVEFEMHIRRFAKSLLAAGVRPGDRVATLSTPRPEYWACFIATTSIGAVWVGLNPRYQLREIQHIIEDSSPTILFGLAEFEGRDYRPDLAKVVDDSPSVNQHILFGTQDDAMEDFLAKSDSVTDADLDEVRGRITGDEPSVMVYTSGTTGSPKGALLSQAGLCYRFGISASHVNTHPLRMVGNLPINHVGGMGEHGCMPLMGGGTIIFQERFDPERYLSAVEYHRVTVCMQIPTMFKIMSEHPRFYETDWSSVKLILWGGGALPLDVIRRYRGLGLNLKTMYGITETATALTFTEDGADDDVLSNTTGKPVPEYSVGLIRGDGSSISDSGEEGEVVVDNTGLWLGYHKNRDATEAVIASDGRYRTGDIGLLRDDGNLTLVGRMKEMYKSGGYNVYPREVELVLESHPNVRLAVVAGKPDAHYGETGVAFVETAPDSAVSGNDLSSWCRERLANYKIPKHFALLDELPLLPTGKVDRKGLKDRAQEL